LDAPMIWPITNRDRAVLEQPVTCACVKHAAAPHGPFGAIAASQVFRLSRSLFAIRFMWIDRSSS
jgi:hypothetical protein